jgi:putative transcriptional regulator
MKPITILLALLLLPGTPVRAAPAIDPAPGTLVPAAGRFLVARRDLYAPFFSRSVVYLIQHDDAGTAGVIVNRPLGKRAADLLPDLSSPWLDAFPVYRGGPVSPRIMLLLFRGSYRTELAQHVSNDVYASSDSTMLEQLMRDHKPVSELRLFAGHAGWLPGQLAAELARGDWYVTEGDPDMLFSGAADGLWRKLIDRLDPQGILVLRQAGRATASRL